jgi:hypothetical protein
MARHAQAARGIGPLPLEAVGRASAVGLPQRKRGGVEVATLLLSGIARLVI